ncbi:MAG: Re/Si-specific NAD(P)(+) transhydrogenase subunit alpha [Bacteroidetes bacterium]|nr:Re/Si-specific NAD(P)(+) transhydrogenase subunit alpha [bacterium]NBP64940.1 Re/Si-specific NAD(P)(+) transhydrogenase subunit alpha [Bacteroidota bacterium]
MKIGIVKEPDFEARVSMLPEGVATLISKGHTVFVESNAGLQAFATNEDYAQAGATVTDLQTVISESDILLSMHAQSVSHIQSSILIGMYSPLSDQSTLNVFAANHNTVFSMDMLPRTTRAQSMDILSSQANIAGYKAVLLAATTYSRYFPMFMTAAGSIAPAKMLILGAGVAGLQAIATARRLGAVVEVFDTRPAVKEEVQSLGAKFIEVEGAADASSAGGYAVEQSEEFKTRQQARIAESAAKADIIITTAQIPGRKAPILITQDMLNSMRKGSIIIDLAASTGGNTPMTKDDETITHNGITIVGNSNLARMMPADASKLYGKNIINFLQLITGNDATVHLNFEDDLVKGTCIMKDGSIIHERLST